MITAVDTNILVDVINPGEPFAPGSERALLAARASGTTIVCEPVVAELAAHFGDPRELLNFTSDAEVRLEPSSPDSLFKAGQAWIEYNRRRPSALTCPECGTSNRLDCRNCGRSVRVRQHILADFIIGAHALVHADQLLTRDRGYYATYFPDLKLA